MKSEQELTIIFSHFPFGEMVIEIYTWLVTFYVSIYNELWNCWMPIFEFIQVLHHLPHHNSLHKPCTLYTWYFSPNFKDLFNSMVTLVIHGYLKPNDLRTELEKSPETQFISLYSLIYTFAGMFLTPKILNILSYMNLYQ